MRSRIFAAALAVVFSVLSVGPALAAGGQTGNLNGTIIDAASKAPIAGASILAKSGSGSYSATTDAKGEFTILGLSVDSYTVTITAKGHQTTNITGVIVFGGETDTIGTVAVQTELQTIARVTSRSASSAYQPTQTIDSYTVNQAQIQQSTGNPASTNENAALLAVPGVTLTNNNNSAMGGTVTVRGGAAAEVGYQYDGVNFKEPFLGENGSNALMNGVASIQVVEGAGDATQGGVGSGVINVVPQRGAGPGSGSVNFDVGGPNFSHQFAADYGFSSPDGRFSEYFSYNGQRYDPYYGYSSTPLNQYGNYFATTYAMNSQFTNNFFYKFGKNLNQQIQVLYTNITQEGFGSATGPGLSYYPYDQVTQGLWEELTGLGSGLPPTAEYPNGISPAQYASLIGLGPGVPTYDAAINNPQQNYSNVTTFLKVEYDNNISPSTYLALRYYNWFDAQNSDDQYSQGPWGGGDPGITAWQSVGGQTAGMSADIEHQIGANLTVSLEGQYNDLLPEFSAYEPQLTTDALLGTGLTNQPLSADWFPGGSVYDTYCSGVTYSGYGPLPSCDPRFPTWGINYNKSMFQNWGVGLRLQYNPSDKLKVDLGLRDEGQNRHWYSQLDQYGLGAPSEGYAVASCAAYAANPANYASCPMVPITNPFDVPYQLWNAHEPDVLQPRVSISYQVDRNDSLRFGYGRSAVFADAQTAGTPFAAYGLNAYTNIKVPASVGGVPTLCGWNSSTFPNEAVFPCTNLAQQLYWQGDNLEAPDAENLPPAIYTNYDLSWNHLFASGWGLRLTPFFKEGTGLPTYYLLNPVLGIFAISTQGFNKTTGVEFGLTTPQTRNGLSGFFTATYQNVLSTTPPFTSNETTVPTNSLATLELGDIYRAGYVSPASLRIGAVDNLKGGWSISPQIEYNIGYPYSVGNMIASCIATNSAGVCTHYANVPQVDFGPGVTAGQSSLIGGNPGSSISTNYYDPAYAGTSQNPNIAATRGTPATAANGGELSHPNLTGDLTIEWKHQGNTIGVQMMNLFANAWYGTVPAINPWYQPVATGVSGPGTGINSCINQTGNNVRGCYEYVPKESYAFTNGAYLLSNGNFTGTPTFGPLAPFGVYVYYRRAL
jgi:hypothetical protein